MTRVADHEQARSNKQMSAAIRAAELLGRELHGVFVERREVSTRDDVRQLSDDQLYEHWPRRSNLWARRNLPRKFDGWGKRDHALVVRQ
jgi:hypothetical protein